MSDQDEPTVDAPPMEDEAAPEENGAGVKAEANGDDSKDADKEKDADADADTDKDKADKDKDDDMKDDDEKKEKKKSRKDRDRDDDDKDKKKKDRKRDRERERDRDRERDSKDSKKRKSSRSEKGRDRDRDRERERRSSKKDKDDKGRDRDRDRERRREEKKERPRTPSPSPETKARLKAEQEAEDERKKNNHLYTVFVQQIHPKVVEMDLFEFFSHVGRVEDIRLIMDQRTKKSKGLCYVEFREKESVPKAISLTGQLIGGYPITIIPMEAKKVEEEAPVTSTMRLYVGSLHPDISEDDLKEVFQAFGELEFITLHTDEQGVSKGYGFVQYKREEDARTALEKLNGLPIAGTPIKVGIVDQAPKGDVLPLPVPTQPELDLDEGGASLKMSKQGRAELMQKLSRGENLPGLNPVAAAPVAVAAAPVAAPVVPQQPSTCVVIKNVFNPAEETDPEFHLDIKEDMDEELSKKGDVRHLFVDKDSQGGFVYVRMGDIAAAQQVVTDLHGRWFSRRQLSAEFVLESMYCIKFPEAK